MSAPEDVVALGIDVGTTNTKAALVSILTGGAAQHAVPGGHRPPGRHAVSSGHRLPDAPGPSGGHRAPEPAGAVRELVTATTPTPDDALALVAAVGAVVREVLDRYEAGTGSRVRPAAVGVASMAETGVPLGRDGVPLTGLLRWDGHRAADQAAALARTHGAEALFAATGVRPGAKVPLATWAWLREQGVRPHRWAGAADLVVLALTGRLVTDHTLAGRTMAYRAVVDEPLPTAFDEDLLALVGLGPGALPEVARPDAVAGRVVRPGPGPGADGGPDHRPLAEALGLGDVLAPGTPVVVAGHDHAVGAWAAGVRTPGRAADSLGTAEAVLTVLDRAPDPGAVAAAGMSWVRTVSGRHHALLAGSSSAGAMLGWLQGLVAPTPLTEALEGAAGLLRRGGTTGGGGQDDAALLVLPYLAGRQTPAPDPGARVRVLVPSGGAPDLELDDDAVRALASRDPARLARAVLEGVCLQARWMLAEQRALGTVASRGPLTVLGGGARTVAAWTEAKHRLTGEPLVWVTAGEPVAGGAALLAAARAGLLGEPAGAVQSAPVLDTTPVVVPGDHHGDGHRREPAGAAAAAEAALHRFVRAATGLPAPAAATPTTTIRPMTPTPDPGGTS